MSSTFYGYIYIYILNILYYRTHVTLFLKSHICLYASFKSDTHDVSLLKPPIRSNLYIVSLLIAAMWLCPLWLLPLALGYQGPPRDGLSDWSVELKDLDPTCSCQPSSHASDGELLQLQQWNCLRIRQAGVDLAKLAGNYGQDVNSEWKARLKAAEGMCNQTNGTSLASAAKSACCAWGDVLMNSRECCNVPGPPYCTNPTDSKLAHASVLVLALLLALLAAFLPKVSASFYSPSLMVTKGAAASAAEDEAQEVYRAAAAPPVSELSRELEAIWDCSTFSNLPQAKEWKVHSAQCFASMQVAFDFQRDSVKNQYEHFISLWRSHLSVLCDREKRRRPEICEEPELLQNALKEFLSWHLCD